ncbi:hypothetical protein ACEPAI_1664 [Sanghuangporus weigelae]
MNVGRAIDLLAAYAHLQPTDAAYDEDEKESAEDIVAKSGTQKDHLVKVYKAVLAIFEDQKDLLEGLTNKQEKALWYMVQRKACQGRNNDTSTVKQVAV